MQNKKLTNFYSWKYLPFVIKNEDKFKIFMDDNDDCKKNFNILPCPDPITKSFFVGMEVEVENITSASVSRAVMEMGWRQEADNSLRNKGIEFISPPTSADVCFTSLRALWAAMSTYQKQTPSFKWRSSFHLHLNVRDKDTDFICKLLLLYSIFENSLFDFAGNERRNSNFCIPLNDTQIQEVVSSFIFGKIPIDSLVVIWSKYSALNLCPIDTYGTIEFRQMGGTKNLIRLYNWMNLIFALYEFAEMTTVTELEKIISSLNTTSLYEEFKHQVFGQFSYLLSSPESHKKMREGVLFAKLCITKNPTISKATKSKFKEMNPPIILGAKPLETSPQIILDEFFPFLEDNGVGNIASPLKGAE